MKLKARELRKMTIEQLESKFLDVRKDLLKVNAQIASGTVPENPGNVKNMKKTSARILTVIHQKKMGGEGKKSNE